MNIRTTEISLFASYFDKKPHCTISFELFCSAVIYEEFRDAVNEIRSSENKAERDKLKAILPAVTISGLFAERKSECLVKHSGLICLDFDSNDNPSVSDWEEIKKTLSEVKNVAFAALSVSGRGCFAIIPLGFPHRHLEQFKALQIDFIMLGLKIDKACSDVSRLRGMTSDPKAWYNPEARPYMKVPLQAQRNRVNSVNSRDNASSLIDKIVSSGIDITSSYSNWYQIGAALASEYHESGRDYFHSISQAYHDYNFSECNRQYNACLKNHGGYTIGTLFYYARQAGIR